MENSVRMVKEYGVGFEYNDYFSPALYDVTFTGGNFDESSLQALEDIRALFANYDTSLYTEVGFDQNAMLDDEMLVILIVAVFIIIIVL